MTVCGWGTGGQHCDSQLHLKQTESPKKGFSLRLFSSCSASSCPPHLLLPLHTQTYADAEVADSVKPGLHASTSLHLQLESLWSKVISFSLKNRAYVSVQYLCFAIVKCCFYPSCNAVFCFQGDSSSHGALL